MMRPNILEMTGNALIGLAHFKESLKYFAIYAAKKSLLSFKSFPGRSTSCIVFELLMILISFVASATVTELNVNLSRFPRTAVISSTLGRFLHFIIAFKVGWSILSNSGSAFCDSGKFRLVTMLEKKSFKLFATFCSSVISSSSSVRAIFSEEIVLLGRKV